jgi:hypothetical protein
VAGLVRLWVRRLVVAIGSLFAVIGVLVTAWAGINVVLFRAASRGDLGTIEAIANWGGNLDARESEGETPLMNAAAKGRTEAVSLLLKRGADVNAVSHNNETALARAVLGGHALTVDVLLKGGAKPNFGDGAPLRYAAAFNHPEILKMILDRGADVNVKDSCGATALIDAIVHDVPAEITGILLSAGADAKVKSCEGKTAIRLAAEKGRPDIVMQLRQAGTSELNN